MNRFSTSSIRPYKASRLTAVFVMLGIGQMCVGAPAAPLGSVAATLTSSTQQVGIGGLLTVKLAFSEASDDKHKIQNLVLFLDNNKLKTLHPVVNMGTSEVTFRVERNPDDRHSWTALLSRPGRYLETWWVSVGYDDLGPVTGSARVAFQILTTTNIRIFGAIIGALLLVTGWASLYTGMLREGNSFSLSRTQMAFWFLLVVAGFLFIGTLVGDPNVQIPNSILGLMGISAATGLAATVVDGKPTPATPDSTPASTSDVPVGTPAPTPANPAPAPALPSTASAFDNLRFSQLLRKFASDMVSTKGSVDLHRLQIVVWTLALGFIFVRSVYNDLALPDFDASLLGLMGISSGTYVGFKAAAK